MISYHDGMGCWRYGVGNCIIHLVVGSVMVGSFQPGLYVQVGFANVRIT